MKPKMMVHGSLARCISSPQEVERLLSQGWLIGAPKPKSNRAKAMRILRARRRSEGWQSLSLWLSPDHAATVKAALKAGEGYAELLMRLVLQEQGSH